MTGKRWVLILPALLLAACSTGQQATAPTPTSTTAPAPAASTRALGLYELSIQGSGAQASGRVTPAALRSQEIAGLTFTVTGVQVVTNGDGSRSYTAALNVTNTSGAAIGAPAIIPADIAGYTESGTYFRAGATTNQSGAPTSASGITLTQVTDSTYSMLFPVTGVSGADFAVPGGSSVTAVSAQGWRTPTLAAGATQAMSLGFTIPASNDAYRFSLVFGAFDKTPAVNHLVISQLYGAGGNAGATLTTDYVELFNPTNNVISTAGMSLQYASPAGAFVTNNTGQFYSLTTASIAPGRFLLIRMPIGANGGTVTATPDQQGTLALGAANGKVALASNGTAVAGPTAPNVIDFIGYGAGNNITFEGTAAAPAMSVTLADQRSPSPCTDTNNNSADLVSFTVTAGSARNSSSTPVACP
ncbi:lamin tail domain-containing protein [Deinococcus kurensis]|uniref:lamin tail domain-containing protein n=1 Tax=Deinococcus kurensis TaxID=2662757 RepID=UPI0012D32AA7|nr:lamin tail domain-containing protein [Deinococcus kurensis]